jgi:hypothetical protein
VRVRRAPERSQNAAWGKARLGAQGLGGCDDRLFQQPASADLDETLTCILLWASVGGSSSGRTSVSGSDYLGSIPSPPAK